LALCRAHHGTVLMMRGEWAEAEEKLAWAADALTILRPPLAGYARARLAQLRLRQGRTREARALLEQSGAHVLAPLVWAEVALDDNDPPAALGYAERYLRGLGNDQPIESAAALELLVAIRTSLGELSAARTAHAQLAVIADSVVTDQMRAAERGAAGRIAAADQELDAARRAFEDALDLHVRSVAPFEAAQARLELARTLRAQNSPAAALGHALAARTTFKELGAERAVRGADKLVAQLGGRTAAATRAGMTRREVQVLSLVADGLSNRQIAEQLVVSEHTVHRHLANIYARLGVSSRAAAVAVASEHNLLV
jgi:ATP/maltotriose-dependent transcriptional regulator MalT